MPASAVHLVVDGVRIDAQLRGLELRFPVPAAAREVWLVSPAASPNEITPGNADGRLLGADVVGLVVDDGGSEPRVIAAEDPRLCVGFHGCDGGHRWTNGRARLPAELWEGCRDAFVLRVDLARPPLPRRVAPAAKAGSAAPVRTGTVLAGDVPCVMDRFEV